MIDKTRSKALHLLVALPLAALSGSFALFLIAGIDKIGNAKFNLETLGAFLEGIVAVVIGSIFMLIFVMPVGLLAFFALRRLNQLKSSVIIPIGVVIGLLFGLTLPSNKGGLVAVVAFSVIGLFISATSYLVLRKLAGAPPDSS
jgi:hypothetical protein